MILEGKYHHSQFLDKTGRSIPAYPIRTCTHFCVTPKPLFFPLSKGLCSKDEKPKAHSLCLVFWGALHNISCFIFQVHLAGQVTGESQDQRAKLGPLGGLALEAPRG